ncbi:helix-turn-helix transcriptional regulator [Oryzomonas japonica]|uniref:Helix-turn-helix transcriptional regulator n=1 Tax=Oryzomonas japonica TaxID=2603858 RepID=A0A7J4ZW57_9BACT|nr:helix-turn-helix transcriptional regulator [Oryzomonas japonica]KAB0667699.1 helix-turn-helix transcriptional regulator [Oryzomonas japonica]
MDQKEFQMVVGRQVRLHRKSQGLSQERLAELADVHHTYISNIERGKVTASAYSFYKIAQALGIKFVDLFGLLDSAEDLDFEIELVEIMGKIRQMDDVQRGLYLAAIKGMLPK